MSVVGVLSSLEPLAFRTEDTLGSSWLDLDCAIARGQVSCLAMLLPRSCPIRVKENGGMWFQISRAGQSEQVLEDDLIGESASSTGGLLCSKRKTG